jgi:hypothetical protein
MEDRYWFDNSLADEEAPLRLLETSADPRSIRLLNDLPVEKGWRCAERGRRRLNGSMVGTPDRGRRIVDVRTVTIEPSLLQGHSPEAAFWTYTFRSAEDRLTDPHRAATHRIWPVGQSTFEEAMACLADEAFWTPFSAVVCAGCRRP